MNFLSKVAILIGRIWFGFLGLFRRKTNTDEPDDYIYPFY